MIDTSQPPGPDRPRFTIVVPVFNAASYLADCLESVLGQTEPDWECICIDDGSMDDSGALLDKYAARDSRFRVFHQKNAGEGPSRNRALDEVRGRFVVFLDSDDLLEHHVLSVHRAAFERHPAADCSLVGLIRFPESRTPAFDNPPHPSIVATDISKSYRRPLNERYFVQYAYSSQLLRAIRFPSLACGADGVFLGRSLDRARLIVESDFTGYGYRVCGNSASGSANMAPRHFLGWLEQDMTLLSIMADSSKQYGPTCYHGLFYGLTQYLASIFFRRLDEAGRRDVFKPWMASFRKAAKDKGFSLSEKLQLWLLSCLNSQSATRLLCDWRHWLRSHGLTKARLHLGKAGNT